MLLKTGSLFVCTKTTFNTFLINRYILGASAVAVVCPFNKVIDEVASLLIHFGLSMLFSDAKMKDNSNKQKKKKEKRFKSTFLIETNG